jgi:TolB protein
LACGSGETLFWFDPATATDTPLLGPQVNGGGVLAALPYPGLQP